MGTSENETLERGIIILTELGLSAIQAKVYLALAQSTESTAIVVANISGVARPDVYRVLSQLEKMGLVQTIVSEPKHFQALPINEIFSMLISGRERKTTELRNKTQDFVRDFKHNVQEEETNEKPEFMFILKKEGLFNKSRKMIAETRKEVSLLGARKIIFCILTDVRYIEAALARNVSYQVLINTPGLGQEVLRALEVFVKYPSFKLKVLEEPMKASFAIYDGKQMVVGTSSENSASLSVLWSDNKFLVYLAQDYFEKAWKRARPFKRGCAP